MKKVALKIVIVVVLTAMLPLSVYADGQNADSEQDTYNELGIKHGTEVYGEDISELSEEELQYIPYGWRDGIFEEHHTDETEDENARLQATYPDVNQYIKNRKYKPVNIEESHISHLPKFAYRNGVGAVEGVVAHETANDGSTITSEIQFMSRNWMNAFVHAFVNDDRIIEVHPTDYGAWGAGRYANQRFIHVELVRVHSFDEFARSINNYAHYIATLLYEYDLGVTDAERTGKGTLWSHKAVTTHLGGTDHVDPHGYFSRYGYSWNEFVNLVKEKYDSFGLPRISGKDRYHTSVEVSKKGWNSANTVIVARGDEYADALAGVPLAKMYNAPLLLTQANQLTKVTKQEIQRLGTKNIYVLGGKEAVNDSVITELKKMNIKVERIDGKNRIETATQIANHLLAGNEKKEVMLVNGYNFADALAVAPYAAAKSIPILLTETNNLATENKEVIQKFGIEKTFVIGGTAVVSKSAIASLPNPIRISGSDRYSTAVELAKYFKPHAKDFYIATGTDFPDSLSGAVLASRHYKSLLLVPGFLIGSVRGHINKNNITDLTILGGPSAVNKEVDRELSRLLK